MTTIEFNSRLINMEDRLERFALSLTSNREEAKDLLQETYLKALSSKDKFIEFTNIICSNSNIKMRVIVFR